MTRIAPKLSTVGRLLALSGNRCAFPDCTTSLVLDGSLIGIMAHICAAEPLGPRFDPAMTDEERRSFENLLYMCPTHSMLIDKPAQTDKYPVEWLRQVKHQHESKYADDPYPVSSELLDEASDAIAINMQQTNNFNGTGTQNNNQTINIFGTAAGAAAAMGEIATTIQKPTRPEPAEEGSSEDDSDDYDEPAGGATVTRKPDAPAGGGTSLSDDKLGSLDKIALAEEALPLWAQTIVDISQRIETVSGFMRTTTRKINTDSKSHASISARLRIIKGLTKELDSPANDIERFGLQYQQYIHQIDGGLRETIRLLAEEAARSNDDTTLESARAFYATIGDVISKSDEGYRALEGFINSMRPIENMSRDLPVPLSKVRKGLNCLDTRELMSEWHNLIEESKTTLNSSTPSPS